MTLRIQLTSPPTLKLDIVLNATRMKHTTMQNTSQELKTKEEKSM